MNSQNDTFEIVTASADETIEIGRRIGSALGGGEVIALVGNLGSGKTHLIKGIATGAGATDSGHVNSPTFVMVNEYLSEAGGLDVFHIDAYRIESIREFEMLGFDEFCYRRSVVVIEWADKVAAALVDSDCIRIELSHVDENHRKILLKNVSRQVIDALK
jgi:tRNA threonylcarbamoyladenosine biosynthesis protein TsaE